MTGDGRDHLGCWVVVALRTTAERQRRPAVLRGIITLIIPAYPDLDAGTRSVRMTGTLKPVGSRRG
jgi:hypothetical protein